jgi:hypothetical protein
MKQRRYKERRPIRLGCMQVTPTRYTEPSYFRALLSVGLIDPKTSGEDSWGLWQLVCSDKIVIKLSMELQKKQHNVVLPSVASPFKVGTQVLASMSQRQINALKKRIGK